MDYSAQRALQLLRVGTRLPEAQFRPQQQDAIRHIVEGRGRLLVVQKTGWGKSFVYFIACRMLRDEGYGPALLISPLLALMRNQIAAAERMGLRSDRITSDNQESWDSVEQRARQGELDLLLVSPERLANDRFRRNVLAGLAQSVSLLIVDEAHCISDWGHDFRPHYRLVERIVRQLPANVRLLATTATANNRVMRDLNETLGPNLTVLRGDLNRPSLSLQTIRLPGQAQRMAWIAKALRDLSGSGVIYTLTIRDAQQVAGWLQSKGFPVEAYTGDMGPEREWLEQALLENKVKALVATTALGMGFDKPDLAFVIHYQSPGSAVAYYQQVGRAGRALPAARGVLLSGEEDTEVTDYFISSAFPTREEADQVIEALRGADGGLGIGEIEGRVNIRNSRIKKSLELLSLESPAPVVKQASKWSLTAAPLSEAFWERIVRLTRTRREEQQQMQAYVGLQSGHMEFLISALDGDPGGVAPPALPPMPDSLDSNLVREAAVFLRRTNLVIEPRKRWPAGGLAATGVQGLIKPETQASPGRALCYWGDAGWGELVQAGKYEQARFGDELVEGVMALVKRWNPAVNWVTCIPSLRQGELVRDFATRLASAMGLPFRDALEKTAERPQQKHMANSAQQARNVDGAMRIRPGTRLEGNVLLVDDIVDSGWTFTVAAHLLRSAGSGDVYPIALANTGYRS